VITLKSCLFIGPRDFLTSMKRYCKQFNSSQSNMTFLGALNMTQQPLESSCPHPCAPVQVRGKFVFQYPVAKVDQMISSVDCIPLFAACELPKSSDFSLDLRQ
jgi:hypothetical protein